MTLYRPLNLRRPSIQALNQTKPPPSHSDLALDDDSLLPHHHHHTLFTTMLARGTLARAAAARTVAQGAAAPTCARNMATLRELELRLKSVRNIEKITKVRSGYN